MASRKPVIHGSDHLPGHADPIPGLTVGGGIQFDTNPQAGTWLYVETTGDSGSGVGVQFILDSSSVFRIDGAGGFTVDLDPGGGSLFFRGDGFTFQDSGIAASFSVAVGASIGLNAANGGLTISSSGIQATSNDGSIQLYGTDDVTIRGRTPASYPTLVDILRVTHDPTGVAPPTYHILTGATWAADL